MKLFEVLNGRWHDRAKARAMRDPEYAAIEAKRDTGRDTSILFSKSKGLGWPEWKKQQDILYRMTRYPKYLDVLAWLHRRVQPRKLLLKAQTATQRVKFGWSIYDSWNMSFYISKIISEMSNYMRDNTHGHPMSLTEEAWEEILIKIRNGFEAGILLHDNVYFDKAEEAALKATFDEGFKLLHEWYFHLWD